MEEKMRAENSLQTDNISSFLLSSYSSTLIMQCERILSNNQQLIPPYFLSLLEKKNIIFHPPKTLAECVIQLGSLMNSTNESDLSKKAFQPNYNIQERSRSLIVFVILIAVVSVISIIGNLCLAKVLYSKRFRLLQTDRIVLCLALSELCLVLIDSPAEIYRFLSYSFSPTWLCHFHTFFESLFSSCIIFYHLLGAFDRFVYIHGHTTLTVSPWSKWCRRISTKSGSIILLIIPILCSLPIAVCNLLHAHVIQISSSMNICVVQYTHGILISFLILFYILPLLFAFFLHGKLIYFIRSKHHQHYLTPTTSYMLRMKHKSTLDSQTMQQKKRYVQKQSLINSNQQLLHPKIINTKALNRQHVMLNKDTTVNTAGRRKTTITTTTVATVVAAAGHQIATNNSSNSSASSRSSTGTGSASITSPIILYKINSQANANANRTVLLLVLLLSFYVICWAPYNIYTWRHAYQLTINKQPKQNYSNRTLLLNLNETLTKVFRNTVHTDLRRIILINYSLYLLSMISMCFSFVFYFSLNKQARHEFSRTIGCICRQPGNFRNEKRRKKQQQQPPAKRIHYQTRYQNHYGPNNIIVSPVPYNIPRARTTKFTTHPIMMTQTPLLINTKIK